MLDIKQKIEEELRELENELKVELPKELKRAVALGDLRENAEYKAARERQDYIRARIGALRQRLADFSMINLERLPRDRAAYGSTLVLYEPEKGEEVTYKLVMSEEADTAKGLISTSSPIGRSLVGKREGDTVEVQTPSGVRYFEVIKLTTIHDEFSDQT